MPPYSEEGISSPFVVLSRRKEEKKLEQDKLVRVKYVIMVQVIRDILIENGLITREQFREKLLEKVKQSGLSEEDIKELMKNI
jgi:hypothetical protein